MTSTTTNVWPTLSFRDASAAMTFLTEAFGLEVVASYAREDDPQVIEHAELRWPRGGGIMLGTAPQDDSVFGQRILGNDAVYLVCDDPDALFERATAAGAEIARGLRDEDYGSRGFTARDPEGNLWSFGTYAGAAAAVPPPADRATFTALLADWNKAIVANDAEAIAAYADPDWVFVGENGTFTGAQFLDSVAAGRVTHDSMTSEVQDVRAYGDVVLVIARVRNSGAFNGEPFTLDEWTSDVFIARDGAWRCLLTHLTSVAGQG